jgi:hypothetical protein
MVGSFRGWLVGAGVTSSLCTVLFIYSVYSLVVSVGSFIVDSNNVIINLGNYNRLGIIFDDFDILGSRNDENSILKVGRELVSVDAGIKSETLGELDGEAAATFRFNCTRTTQSENSVAVFEMYVSCEHRDR